MGVDELWVGSGVVVVEEVDELWVGSDVVVVGVVGVDEL